MKEWWRGQLIQLVTGFMQCWGVSFLALSGPVVQNREFWHKPNIVNCFNCLWSDLKKELWEQLKFLADLLNSVILCKHLWLDWSVPLLHTKIIECSSEIKENSFNSLHHFLISNQSKTLVFTTVFFLFQGRKLIGICYHVIRCMREKTL